jgi:hypothetical protein
LMILKKIYMGPNQENPNPILKRIRIHRERVAVTATLFLIYVNHLDCDHLVFFRSTYRD